MGLAILLSLNLLFAGTAPFFKLASHELSPVTCVWLRHTIALVWLVPWVWRYGLPRFSRPDLLRIIAAALTAFTGASLLQAQAMHHASASSGAILVAMEPILMLLFALLFLHEPFRKQLAVGFVLAVGGFVVLSWSDGSLRLEGNVLYLIAILVESIYPTLVVPLLRRYQPVQIAFCCLLCSSVALLPFQSGALFTTVAQMSWKGWAALLYLGIACSGTATILWLYAMQRFQAGTVAVSWFLQPVWGSVLAVCLLDETLTMQIYLGGGMILGAVAILCSTDRMPRRAVARCVRGMRHVTPLFHHPAIMTLSLSPLQYQSPLDHDVQPFGHLPSRPHHPAHRWHTALSAYYRIPRRSRFSNDRCAA